MEYALELTIKYRRGSDGEAAKTALVLISMLNSIEGIEGADEIRLLNDDDRRQVGLDGKPVLSVLSSERPVAVNDPGAERDQNAREEEGDQEVSGQGDPHHEG